MITAPCRNLQKSAIQDRRSLIRSKSAYVKNGLFTSKGSIMRKLIIGAVAAVALLGASAAAEAATTGSLGRTPVTDPLGSGSPNGSITLPAGHNCAFAVGIAVVANNEFQDVSILADGTTVTKIAGKLVLRFKNDTTGKTIKE